MLPIFSSFLACIIIAASINWKPLSFSEKRALISPAPNLEYFSFGYQMPIADSLWLRSLQDVDYCENLLAKNLCVSNGWLSKMFDAITNLAPDYQIVYRDGALALSVLVSDYPGASKIFDKGVRLYPKDKVLLYRAGYHAMIEEKNNVKAAKIFKQAADNGAPQWLYSLATRLYTDAGKKDLAMELYREMSKTEIPEGFLKRMREKLQITD